MKKHYNSLIFLTLMAILVIPVAVKAEDGDDDATPSPSASASVSASATVSPTPVPVNIREKLRLELELKNRNVRANQGLRNDVLEKRKLASTTASTTDKMIRKDLKEIKGDIKDFRKDFREDVKDIRKDAKDEAKDFIRENKNDFRNGSTTKKELRREIEFRLFKIHKDTLVRQLNLALDNLKQIRERIVSRINKAEQGGRNMTEPKALLVTADTKISLAQVAITELINLNVAGTSASSTASTTVKLDRPREIGDKAIKAMKEAREALQKVIVAVAKNMGRGDVQATTTATTTTP